MPEFMVWIWLGVIIAATIIEFSTMDMTSIWFAVGGVIALILSLFKAVPWEAQLAVFIVVSGALVLGLRKIAKKWLLRRSEGRTNLDAYLGMKTRLLKAITEDSHGEIKINDIIWTAVTENGKQISADEFVEIIGVKGNKIVVKASTHN